MTSKPAEFYDCLKFTIREEGDYIESPIPESCAKFGVTLARWRNWTQNQTATKNELQALVPDDVFGLYFHLFWGPICGNKLPPEIKLMMFDFGVQANPICSNRILQMCLSVQIDGHVNDATLEAARRADPPNLVKKLGEKQALYYAQLPQYEARGEVWRGRLQRRLTESLGAT